MEKVEYEFFDNGTVRVKRGSGSLQKGRRGKRGLYPDFSESDTPRKRAPEKEKKRLPTPLP